MTYDAIKPHSHSSLMLQCTSHRATITDFGYNVDKNSICMPFGWIRVLFLVNIP